MTRYYPICSRRIPFGYSGDIETEEVDPHDIARSVIARSLRRDDGQGLAEYALILALIAIVAIVALLFLGAQVSTLLSTVGNSV